MGYAIREGNYKQYGVQVNSDGIIFTFEAEKEDECELLFYGKDLEVTEQIPIPDRYCRGAIRSICIEGLPASKLKYNYRIIINPRDCVYWVSCRICIRKPIIINIDLNITEISIR